MEATNVVDPLETTDVILEVCVVGLIVVSNILDDAMDLVVGTTLAVVKRVVLGSSLDDDGRLLLLVDLMEDVVTTVCGVDILNTLLVVIVGETVVPAAAQVVLNVPMGADV